MVVYFCDLCVYLELKKIYNELELFVSFGNHGSNYFSECKNPNPKITCSQLNKGLYCSLPLIKIFPYVGTYES